MTKSEKYKDKHFTGIMFRFCDVTGECIIDFTGKMTGLTHKIKISFICSFTIEPGSKTLMYLR
jgi:hypothetical protein